MRYPTCEIKIAKGGENLILPSVIQTDLIFFSCYQRTCFKINSAVRFVTHIVRILTINTATKKYIIQF